MPSANTVTKPKQTRLPPEQRQAQILDACLAVVANEGFHAVTLDRIARDCGVSRTVIYQQFGSLEAMLVALADREAQLSLQDFAEAAGTQPILDRESFVAVATAGYGTVRRRPEGWRMLLAPSPGGPREVYEHLNGMRALTRDYLVETISRLRPAAAERDVELAAAMFQVANEEGARLLLQDPPMYEIDEVVQQISMVFWAVVDPLAAS